MTQYRSVPAPFLTKTYHLVGDPTTDEVISWGKDGTTFVVWKTAELSRDLLPVYFKHNNFSSFIRQLNTYGFRKIVPDKWEFLNENFKQGSPELLHKIRRRKNINNTPGKANGNANAVPSDSNSVEDLSTSASSSKNQAASEDEPLICAKLADLSNENENLKKHNEMLISELAQSKKQCEELVAFLSKNLNLDAAKLHCILENVTCSSSSSKETVVNSDNDESMDEGKDDNDESVDERKDDKGLKLFGVLLHGNNKQNEKRRCVEDGIGDDCCQSKKMKGGYN